MRSRVGFTLVEVMIVITITAMLSGLVLVYNSSTRANLALFTEKVKIAQLMLRAKSLALSTYASEDVPCGYGVAIDERGRQYYLFAYRREDCSDISRVYADDSVEVVENSRFILPSTVSFTSEESGEEGLSYLVFIPPDPRVLLANGDGALLQGVEGRVVMSAGTGVGSSQATITVNSSGQVTF